MALMDKIPRTDADSVENLASARVSASTSKDAVVRNLHHLIIEEMGPQLTRADSDEVVLRVPVAEGSTADGSTIAELQLDIEPGFHVLAVVREGRHIYRPRGYLTFAVGDELIATGPPEGRGRLAELCGWRLVDLDEDDPLSEIELVSLREAARS